MTILAAMVGNFHCAAHEHAASENFISCGSRPLVQQWSRSLRSGKACWIQAWLLYSKAHGDLIHFRLRNYRAQLVLFSLPITMVTAPRARSILTDPRNANVSAVIEDAEGIEEPKYNANHHDDVKDLFDLSIHRDVGVHQPEQHSDNYQSDYKRYKRHAFPSI
jgi:hypothetical protein